MGRLLDGVFQSKREANEREAQAQARIRAELQKEVTEFREWSEKTYYTKFKRQLELELKQLDRLVDVTGDKALLIQGQRTALRAILDKLELAESRLTNTTA